MSRNDDDKQSYCAGLAITEIQPEKQITYEHRIIWANDRIAGFMELEADSERNLTMPEYILVNEVKYWKEK